MSNSPENGIVILNYNTFEDTVRCVDSIFKYTSDIADCSIYIVDNASPDGSGNLLKAHFQDNSSIQTIFSERNLGFSSGNNLGIRQALEDGCGKVFLLNSDIYLTNDAIGIMSEKLDSDEDIVAIGPAVFNTKGTYIQFARKALTFKDHLAERMPMLGDKQVRRIPYDQKKDFVFSGMSSGCCFGLKTDFVKSNKLLDDHIFMYYEEDILAHQIINAEKKACICADARIIHNEASSTKKTVHGRASFERMHRWASALYVLKEYGGISDGQKRFLYDTNLMEWKTLSIWHIEYRDRYRQFKRLLDEYMNKRSSIR